MPYKPKFCCQCGERVERTDWKPWTSRRFCELCETEFGIHDKFPMILAIGGILIGAVGFANFLRTPQTGTVAPSQFISRSSQNTNKAEANRANLSESNTQTRTQTNNSTRNTTNEPAANNLTTKKSETVSNSTQEEAVYICGAMTRKGTPCSRRVKGGGRCWQHEGQPAMLAQEKLIVKSN